MESDYVIERSLNKCVYTGSRTKARRRPGPFFSLQSARSSLRAREYKLIVHWCACDVEIRGGFCLPLSWQHSQGRDLPISLCHFRIRHTLELSPHSSPYS